MSGESLRARFCGDIAPAPASDEVADQDGAEEEASVGEVLMSTAGGSSPARYDANEYDEEVEVDMVEWKGRIGGGVVLLLGC